MYANSCQSGPTPRPFLDNQTLLTFQNTLQIIDAPLITYNVLLLINFKGFLPFLCRANFDAVILFCSRHNIVTPIFKGKLLQIF